MRQGSAFHVVRFGAWSTLLAVAMGVAVGCTAAPKSTRLTADDFAVTEAKMRDDLAQSDFLRERSPDSPPMIIVVDRVENLTSDVIPLAEQWMAVYRVIDALPIRELRETKNIRIILPRQRYEMLADKGLALAPDGGLKATHLMYAEFRSSSRATRSEGQLTDRRMEHYLLTYRITDTVGREIGWASNFEFRRIARGDVID